MHPGAQEPVTLRGACHCGAVKFRVTLHYGLASARRCTCSYCAMRGAVAVSSKLDGLTILDGADHLSTYRFNTGELKGPIQEVVTEAGWTYKGISFGKL